MTLRDRQQMLTWYFYRLFTHTIGYIVVDVHACMCVRPYIGPMPLLCVQMGYAVPEQTTRGIHFRQYSRAFIFADADKKNRTVFVNMDICMGTQAIKMQVQCQVTRGQ